jgi:hypothetical protein
LTAFIIPVTYTSFPFVILITIFLSAFFLWPPFPFVIIPVTYTILPFRHPNISFPFSFFSFYLLLLSSPFLSLSASF